MFTVSGFEVFIFPFQSLAYDEGFVLTIVDFSLLLGIQLDYCDSRFTIAGFSVLLQILASCYRFQSVSRLRPLGRPK